MWWLNMTFGNLTVSDKQKGVLTPWCPLSKWQPWPKKLLKPNHEETSEVPIQGLWMTVCRQTKVNPTGVNIWTTGKLSLHLLSQSCSKVQMCSTILCTSGQCWVEDWAARVAQSGQKIELKMGVKWSTHWSAEEVKALILIIRGTLESSSDCDVSNWQYFLLISMILHCEQVIRQRAASELHCYISATQE